MSESTEEIVTLFGVICLGLMLGRITWRGISLGTSGVVFVALAAGHLGYAVPQTAGTVGIVLFVYCLGIGAGPSFLGMFLQRGRSLIMLAVCMIISAGLIAWGVAEMLGLSPGLAAGLFAGALTSTPALAAASERLPLDTEVAVGFGIAYPFGVVGVVLFINILPRLLPDRSSSTYGINGNTPLDRSITRVLVDVTNPNVAGKRSRDLAIFAKANCQISRVMVNDKLQPPPASFQLETGQRILVVGAQCHIPEVVEVLGQECQDVEYVLDVERQHRRVVVTSKNVIGQSLKQLHLLSKFGVTISRITRQDVEFVPSPSEILQSGDALTAVGELRGLEQFVEFAGHRERTLEETDLISLLLGLTLGILVGHVNFAFGTLSVSLGLAGGPLLVGLVLGHMGHIGPIAGWMPRAARFLLSEIGLSLFLAQAGAQAGGQLFSVIQRYGVVLPLGAVIIVIVPLAVGVLLAKYVCRLGRLEAAGGICGAMTSTPGLGAVTSMVDSSIPSTSYAAVYPLALILMTILAPVLISQL
ncbi:aspartate:alanine exchanger family transporter [Symmachiella dynata]|uniref:aspartate:alanine exchanger family transporter n=1 Tax=Symmachiella dynata TaxID=2527995 RepID=UPI0030EBEE5E